MNKEEKKILVKKYLDANNSFDIKSLSSLVHTEITYTNKIHNKIIFHSDGLEEFVKFAKKLKTRYSLHKQTINNLEWDDDGLIVELDYEISTKGDNKTRMMNRDHQILNGTINFQFRDGKIIKIVDSRENVV